MGTGVLLPSTRQGYSPPPAFAILDGRKCLTTGADGTVSIDVPKHNKARVIALLPPDTVLFAQCKLAGMVADYTEPEGACWCVSNVDASPTLMVTKNINESGTFTIATFPAIIGMTVCIELTQT
jgi:hypothetical protein